MRLRRRPRKKSAWFQSTSQVHSRAMFERVETREASIRTWAAGDTGGSTDIQLESVGSSGVSSLPLVGGLAPPMATLDSQGPLLRW